MKRFWVLLILAGLLIGTVAVKPVKNHTLSGKDILNVSAAVPRYRIVTESKARIVSEIKQIVAKIQILEKKAGQNEPQGYKVYTARETARFIQLYQDIAWRLHYLNDGDWNINLNQWEGYQFAFNIGGTYNRDQVVRAMDNLIQNNTPQTFVTGLRIYLLPYVIPNVSGLGGNGYIMLSARARGEDLIVNQLPVTLYHEIGHHVNFTFMPEGTAQGDKLWARFLRITGGTWHGPGSVNTKAWDESSEETFAEDFRMLFGKNQPFFGDLALGDPRANPLRAKNETRFMLGLARVRDFSAHQSPWIPLEELYFWRMQGELIVGAWLSLGLALIAFHGFARFPGVWRKSYLNNNTF